MRCSCEGGVFPYHPDGRASRSLRLARYLLACYETVVRGSYPSCVIRSWGGDDDKAWGERRDELNKTARQQDGRQACGILASDKTETG